MRYSNPVTNVPPDLIEPELTENAKIVLENRYLIKDHLGRVAESPIQMLWRTATAVAATEARYGGDPNKTAREFYEIMRKWRFLPNSPTLMNAGKENGQLSACFVLPVGDSIEEIFDAVKYAAMIHKSGGGTGFSFSRLRPADSRVGSTGGVASGPLSFLKIFNTATEQIKQGGARRGANMAILRVDHPDIFKFIRAKEKDGEFNNFNFSVGLTEEFMNALNADGDIELVAPNDESERTVVRAAEIFDLLIEKAWQSGDPGVVFLDRIERDNPTPELGAIEATNPCGEQPLLPYEACNLGSINLSAFVVPGENGPVIDWPEIERVVRLAVRFLDDVVDASVFPLPQIDAMVKKTRKIGLGVMGWADLLYQLQIPYDSEEAEKLAGEVMSFINARARDASMRLAEKRGPYPAWEAPEHDRNSPRLRNATVTTIAPTGTLSIIAGCSSGIEPNFALAYSRHILDGKELKEINPHFKRAMEKENAPLPELLALIKKTGSVARAENVSLLNRGVFVTAMDIALEWHLRIQAAFQAHTDNAVSKTVNLPNSATRDDIRKIYLDAWRMGCKGVTVYRDGCKNAQALTIGESEEKTDAPKVRKRPETLTGFTQKVQTGLGAMYLTVNEADGKPFEVFATIGKSGRSITAKAEAIGRLVSLALRSGIPVREVVDQIKGIGGEHPIFKDRGLLLSIPDAIARVLAHRYLGEAPDSPAPDLAGAACPECGAPLRFGEGCVLCPACGYSKCG